MTIAEKLKTIAIEQWLVLPLFVVGVFASAFHAIPLVTVLYFPLLLSYARQHWYTGIIASLVNLASFWISILGLQDDIYGNGRFQHPWWMLVLAICCSVNVLIALIGDFLASRHESTALRVLVFPLLFAGSWLVIFGHLIGFGDSLAYSNSILTGFPDIVQAATWLGGRPAIDFVLALFATIVLEFGRTSSEKPVFNSNTDDEEEQQQEHTARPKSWLCHPATWYVALLSLLSFFGGWQINIHPKSFFQIAYPDYVPKTVPVGCVIGPGGIHWQLQADHDRWLNRSATLADAGAKLIAWTEETASTKSYDEEASLIGKAQALAKEKQVYLAITYNQIIPPDVSENKLVLVTPEGHVAINYKKAYPVPFIEPRPPGKDEIQYVDTPEFGRISAGICFDFNFPWFIGQASKKNVDVMIESSWTWGPEGTYHGRSNGLRAVENGFTLLRCGSQTMSGIYEPTLDGIFSQHVATITDSEYLFHLPIQKRRKTLYGYTGDLFGFACFGVGLLATVYLVFYTVVKHRRGGEIQV
ncbi:carbon-nitrogen hydrolase [Zychaea mexicana]|uniref:carbon-nitrogen hydrolase n=1 Tax=Zychaea mexicana TaxID=64656 RepID=UPI0022FDF7D2|nr:carbon-nitrogen hydrolase [Zychaea mexicana]KAI9497354.1 carbon-nitrogen hydrolase [Zychaea mexicana]